MGENNELDKYAIIARHVQLQLIILSIELL